MLKETHTYRWKRKLVLLVILFLLLQAGIYAGNHFRKRLAMHENLVMSESFRDMRLSEMFLEEAQKLSEESGFSKGKLLALAFTENGGKFPEKFPDISALEKTAVWAYRWCPEEYERLKGAFSAVWDDVACFPVKCNVSYEDSWMAERTYGGNRGHEGTDLMPPVNQSGLYPVFSMTEGTVEKLGWLEKGGYRVGIRSPGGGYFYYAHLSEYAEELAEGDTVEAGQLLGYMGDTGYGPEGTTGQFAVHLHFGIYIEGPKGQELSINPYWILRHAENQNETLENK